ncbi:hypothetical protein D7S89_23115, partial [Trinickia fusca]
MWYSIDDGKGRVDSFGFAPSDDFNGMNYNGQPFAPGKVYTDDIGRYVDKNAVTGGSSINTQTYPISDQQYRALLDYGQNPDKYGFDSSTYNGASNNCINFTWTALQAAGLNPTGYQGESLPILNKDDVAFNMSVVEFANNYLADQQDRMALEKVLLGQYGDNQAAWNGIDRQFNKLMEDLSKAAAADHMKLGDYLKHQFSDEIAKGEAWLKHTGQRIEDIVRGVGRSMDSLITSLQHLFHAALRPMDPLVLDLAGTGIKTVGIDAGAHFDYNGSGFAQQTAWVTPDEGILVLDKRGDGNITGDELIGNTGTDGTAAGANGFITLASLDVNKNGVIDARSPAFNQLRVWINASGDGKSKPSELKTLSELGITSISLAHTGESVTDANGNMHLAIGSFTTADGKTHTMEDVWLNVDTARTINTTQVPVTAAIAALPDVAGFGNIASLHTAMSRDTTGQLQSLVQAFIGTTDPAKRAQVLTDLLYTWAGVEKNDPHGRDNNIYHHVIDARKVETLEAFMGQRYAVNYGAGADPNPRHAGADLLSSAFDQLAASVGGQILAQTELKDLYAQVGISVGANGKLTVDVSEVVATLGQSYQRDPAAATNLIADLGKSLKTAGDWGQDVIKALRAQGNVSSQGFSRQLAALGATVTIADATHLDIQGLNGTDNFLIGVDKATVRASDGTDTLMAGAGNETLIGGAGLDTFIVPAGVGKVTLSEAYKPGGINHDIVQISDGISAAQTRVYRDMSNNLVLVFGENSQLTIEAYFSSASYQPTICFADGSVLDYKAIADRLVFADTSAGHQWLYGLQGVNNRIVGAASDTLIAGNLNDTITAGKDNTINAGAGTDTFIVNQGTGHVTLNEAYNKTGGMNQDVVQLGVGITAAGTQIARDLSNNLVLSFGNGDQLTISGYFDQASRQPKLVFADGTSWDYKSITDRLVFTDTSAGSHWLYGLQGVNNRIVGAASDT